MYFFDIVIPSHQRPDLLRRTLEFICASQIPNCLFQILIVENGGKGGAESVCEDFSTKLPLKYLYENRGNLSNARNSGAIHSESQFLLFLDDDIRVNPGTLSAYADAFQRHGPANFFGGPLVPDYEKPPEDYLIEFLPWSAKGHSLGEEEKLITKPSFLGGNMAIGRQVFFELGQYDDVSASGGTLGGLGEETRLQQKLLQSGIPGVYVPQAKVGHYVPEYRCNRQFVSTRAWRRGFSIGQLDRINASEQDAPSKHLLFPKWYWRDLATHVAALMIAYLTIQPKKIRFEKNLNLRQSIGLFFGHYSA